MLSRRYGRVYVRVADPLSGKEMLARAGKPLAELEVEMGGRTRRLAATAFVLATGGIPGGGLVAERDRTIKKLGGILERSRKF